MLTKSPRVGMISSLSGTHGCGSLPKQYWMKKDEKRSTRKIMAKISAPKSLQKIIQDKPNWVIFFWWCPSLTCCNSPFNFVGPSHEGNPQPSGASFGCSRDEWSPQDAGKSACEWNIGKLKWSRFRCWKDSDSTRFGSETCCETLFFYHFLPLVLLKKATGSKELPLEPYFLRLKAKLCETPSHPEQRSRLLSHRHVSRGYPSFGRPSFGGCNWEPKCERV